MVDLAYSENNIQHYLPEVSSRNAIFLLWDIIQAPFCLKALFARLSNLGEGQASYPRSSDRQAKQGPRHLRTGKTLAGPREELVAPWRRTGRTFHFLGERTERAATWGPAAEWYWQLLVSRTAVISAWVCRGWAGYSLRDSTMGFAASKKGYFNCPSYKSIFCLKKAFCSEQTEFMKL